MFVHYKGPQDKPRTDKYLFGVSPFTMTFLLDLTVTSIAGSTSVKRFRSVQEFVLHAVWLMMDENLQLSNCGCKYCTRTPQRGISQVAGLTTSSRSLPSSVARIRQSTRAPLKAPRPQAQTPSQVVKDKAKAKVFEPPSVSVGAAESSSPPPQSPKEQVQVPSAKEIPWFAIWKEARPVKPLTGPKLAVNHHRIADIQGIDSPHRRRLHRIAEVIWCFLDVPIAGPGVHDGAIIAWPGFVKNVQWSTHFTIVTGESSVEHRRGDDQPYTYEVVLFNVAGVIKIPDVRVLPYQAMSPQQPLIEALTSLMHTIDRKGHTLTIPVEGGVGSLSKFTFEEVALPYSLAIQAPIMLAKYWACTNSWTFQYTTTVERAVPTPVVPPEKKSRTPGLHIGPMPGLLASASAGSSTPPVEPSAQVKTQKRYQGLWWGVERIWVDDMVRLKVPRSELAPNGSERILSVAPPSKSTVKFAINNGIDSEHVSGSGDKGLFLRVMGIFVTGKRVRISGMLFDLVEDGCVGAGVGGREGRQEVPSTFDTRSLDLALLQGDGSGMPPADRAMNGLKPAPDRQALSGPYVRNWNPPEPPAGHRFRSILKGNWEAVMDISLLSGRYYPRVLSNPLLSDYPKFLPRLEESVHLYALEGLAAGYYNSVDAEFPKDSRWAMIVDAIVESETKCKEWCVKEGIPNLLDVGLTSSTSDVDMEVQGE